MKNAQISTRALIFVVGLLVIVMTILLGYRLISTSIGAGNEAELSRIKMEITADISSMENEYQSKKVENYYLPSGFDEICLVDIEKVNPNNLDSHPKIKNSVIDGVEMNVFLIGTDKFESFYAEGMNLAFPYFTCIEADTGNFEIEYMGGEDGEIQQNAQENYCSNAQSGDLCDSLDIIYGEGYQEQCCSEFGVCC